MQVAAFNDVLDDFFTPTRFLSKQALQSVSALDVVESPTDVTIKVDLPGIEKEKVQIHVKDHVLVISGERSNEKVSDQHRYHIVERSFGSFERRVRLPKNVCVDTVEAHMNNGVLSLKFEKKKEVEDKKEITIR